MIRVRLSQGLYNRSASGVNGPLAMSIPNELSPSSFGGGGGLFIRGSCDVHCKREENGLKIFTHRKYFGNQEPTPTTVAASESNNRAGEEPNSATPVYLERRIEPQRDPYARPHHPG